MLRSKDVTDMFGVTQSTVYNWEVKDILKPILIITTRRKYYSEEE